MHCSMQLTTANKKKANQNQCFTINGFSIQIMLELKIRGRKKHSLQRQWVKERKNI